MIAVRSFFASVVALVAFLSVAPAFAQTVIVSRPGYGPYAPGPHYYPYPPPGPYYSPYPPPPPPPPPYIPPPPQYVPPPPPPPPPPVRDGGYWGFTLGGAGLYSLGKAEPGFYFGGGFRTFSRLSPLDGELELGVGHYEGIQRTDYRLGLNIHASFSKGIVVPYLVAPLALHIATSPGQGITLEGSAGLGLGLGVRFWRMMISADARIRYQDDFEGVVQDDLVGEGRVTLSVFPWDI